MQKLELMVGSNYDPELPDYFKSLNDQYTGVQVHETYGSIKSMKVFGSARPDFRIKDLDTKSFEDYVKTSVKNGIILNYTENGPLIRKDEVDEGLVREKLQYLESLGVGRITISHPLAMEIAARNCNIPIEVSTIYRANSEYQIRELKRRAPTINKICLDVAKNRDFKLLERLKKECDAQEIELELLANEFCISDCADRVQCYNEHAQVNSYEETMKFSNYPMGHCTKLRNKLQEVEWLRARFIIPQSMRWYQENFGINKFKVTGRTHPTPYIKWITETYMKEEFKGNLLGLWADVKNIKRVSIGKEDFANPNFSIDAELFTPEFLEVYRENDLGNDLDKEYEFLTGLLQDNRK